ncbi:MAG: M14 family metallopeptidase [Bacteroidales bacterium]|jgi:hypothetical protein|nr:M14 family metallopeptidase [Bacteroidales bacterium]
MKQFKISQILFLFIAISLIWSCKEDTKWKGQEPIKRVSTLTKPIQLQLKKTYDLGNGIFCSNEFDGARLNGIVLTNDTLVTALITPENTPINGSPWYAFKIWSESKQDIYLKLTYLDGVKHRYYPKLSDDGIIWNSLDSIYYFPDTTSIMEESSPSNISMKLSISSDTLWVSAQELITSKHIYKWSEDLALNSFISLEKIGESREGKAINMLKIGTADDQKMIIVLSRQHPPEISGYLAMKSFVETLSSDTETAIKFRNTYNTYVIPLINPDGVDNGHWRHNSGGIDLNRDWETFNQPETEAVKIFMQNKVAASGGKFYFGVDFHSTFQDIYYTINPELKGNMPGLVPEMIEAMGKEIANYEPNIRPGGLDGPKISSTSYLFNEFGAESVTFEIGDNTPRDLIKQKGEISAIKLMELMLR